MLQAKFNQNAQIHIIDKYNKKIQQIIYADLGKWKQEIKLLQEDPEKRKKFKKFVIDEFSKLENSFSMLITNSSIEFTNYFNTTNPNFLSQIDNNKKFNFNTSLSNIKKDILQAYLMNFINPIMEEYYRILALLEISIELLK